jgi:hypothetical protein
MKVSVGHLEGPIRVPSSELFQRVPDLYIGKVSSALRAPIKLGELGKPITPVPAIPGRVLVKAGK